MKITGNTILLTGASSGIGRALAIQLSQKGNKVIAVARREERLKELSAAHPGIDHVRCDITDASDRQKLFEYVTEKYPELNIIFNDAAMQSDYNLCEGTRDFDHIQTEIDSCFTAHVWINAMFIPLLKERINPAIINVSSVLGFTPLTHIPIYCAAKSACHVYTMLLREQLKTVGIEVYEVAPPKVESELNLAGRTKRNEAPNGLIPDEYAEFVIGELENGTPDIFYPPFGDMLAKTPRPEMEKSRIAPFKEQ